MIRRVPILPTLIVLAAVATMIALGVWQLGRLRQKEALLAHYAAGSAMSGEAAWPSSAERAWQVLYRHTAIDCAAVTDSTLVSGRSASGTSGLARRVTCRMADGTTVPVVLGWTKAPVPSAWHGGRVQGIIAPGPRLVADPPLDGLQANARPDPADLPNNHLSYAFQWFFFAATALVIYIIALRKRLRG